MPSIDMSSNFLNGFWDLASENVETRVSAIKKIVEHLQVVRNAHGASNADRDYAVKRLVRGLSSSRESARLGFSTCLCTLLKYDKAVKILDIMEIIDSSTKVCAIFFCSNLRDT